MCVCVCVCVLEYCDSDSAMLVNNVEYKVMCIEMYK